MREEGAFSGSSDAPPPRSPPPPAAGGGARPAAEGLRDKAGPAAKVHIAPVDQMIRSVESSLRSLKTGVIDIMQLHGIRSEEEVTDGYAREALQKLLEQGKIRGAGVTTHRGQGGGLPAGP